MKTAGRLVWTAGSRPGDGAALLVYDGSYKAVLGNKAWRSLKPEIRSRFSVKPAAQGSIRYRGTMHRVELSFMGWLFAQFCRLFGTPLATARGRDVPVVIELVPDERVGGTAWLRHYDFGDKRPFTVTSTKRFDVNGMLAEHIGHGFSMGLRVFEQRGDLIFVSLGYFFQVAGRRLRIPDWLTPGVTTVTHQQLHGKRFRFTLSVDHPLLGRTIYQRGEFQSD